MDLTVVREKDLRPISGFVMLFILIIAEIIATLMFIFGIISRLFCQ